MKNKQRFSKYAKAYSEGLRLQEQAVQGAIKEYLDEAFKSQDGTIAQKNDKSFVFQFGRISVHVPNDVFTGITDTFDSKLSTSVPGEKEFTAQDKAALVQKLKDFRTRKSLSREVLSAKLGVTPGALYNWEHGKNLPQSSKCIVIQQILDTGEEGKS